MTVKELIEQLKEVEDQDMEVQVDAYYDFEFCEFYEYDFYSEQGPSEKQRKVLIIGKSRP